MEKVTLVWGRGSTHNVSEECACAYVAPVKVTREEAASPLVSCLQLRAFDGNMLLKMIQGYRSRRSWGLSAMLDAWQLGLKMSFGDRRLP